MIFEVSIKTTDNYI